MYAIELLKREKDLIDKCLDRGKWDNHKEALKRQKKKSTELKDAITLLESLLKA